MIFFKPFQGITIPAGFIAGFLLLTMATGSFAQQRVLVKRVYKLGNEKRQSDKSDSAGIGDIIVLSVKNFSTLMNRSNGFSVNASGDTIKGTKQSIGLFLDGRLISGLSPESGAPQMDTNTKEDMGTLRFHLERNPGNDEAWADILGSPKEGNFFIYRNIPVSVGLVNESAEESTAGLNIIRIRQTMFWICLFGLLAYLFGLVVLAQKSNILRDGGIDATSIGIPQNSSSNIYSLGRLQMAFWFSLVVAAYLFIWLITGATDIITSGTLVLIGISGTTALSSVVIGNSKGQDLVTATAGLIDERTSLTVALTAITPALLAGNPVLQASMDEKTARLIVVNAAITKNTATLTKGVSEGFLTDILSDDNGVSFHRLQMLVWTIVLGILFVYSVWTRLSMPEFPATLLALQGITSGTYLGFKIPEKQT
jgi:hypothetical protein